MPLPENSPPALPLSLFSSETLWAIEPSILTLIHSRAIGGGDAKWGVNNSTLRLENKPIFEMARDGIARIYIEGSLMRNPSPLAQVYYGATDLGEVRDALIAAKKDDSIRGVLLIVDSPGGTVNGTVEVANAVAELAEVKKVYAVTEGNMCSAAYWIASQAHAIYATPSATVGSIGVVLPLLDVSKAYDSMGLKVNVFAAGKFKGAGIAGTTLTDEQRTQIQDRIEETYSEFKTAITSRGRKIPASAMEGQTFSSKEAQRNNLAGMTRSVAAVESRLRSLISGGNQAAQDKAAKETDTNPQANSMPDTALIQAQADLATAQAATLTAQTELTTAQTELATIKAELTTAQADLATAQAANVTNAQAAQTAQDALATAQTELATAQAELVTAKAAVVDFDAKLATSAAAIAAARGLPPLDASQSSECDVESLKVSVADHWNTQSKIEDAGEARAYYLKHIKPRQ